MPVKGSSSSALERMQGKFVINIVTRCWEWQRSHSSQGRYPTISVEGCRRPDYAHRVAWESVHGPVPTTPCPDGSHRWELHHTCLNRSCVNPDHIQLVTHREHTDIHNGIRAAIRFAKAA